jgi:hypothetical protein
MTYETVIKCLSTNTQSGKIPVFLLDYKPLTERRRGETVKVLKLKFKVQPFDSKMAHAVDDGVNDDCGVKDALFKISNGQPKPHRRRVNFDLCCPRQRMVIYASTDTEKSRIAFDQVRITGEYARTQKDVNAYAFCFEGTFGPVGRDEMEYVHAWVGTQRAVTFEEAEPSMELENDTPEPTKKADGPKAPALKPMFDDTDPAAAAKPDGTKGKSKGVDGQRYVRRHKDPKLAAKAKSAKARK